MRLQHYSIVSETTHARAHTDSLLYLIQTLQHAYTFFSKNSSYTKKVVTYVLSRELSSLLLGHVHIPNAPPSPHRARSPAALAFIPQYLPHLPSTYSYFEGTTNYPKYRRQLFLCADDEC